MKLCHILGIITLVTGLHGPPAASAQELGTPTISLPEALELAIERNPGLKAFAARSRAADARRTDAGRLANPDLALSAENLGITSRAETSVTLSQPLDIGGDRGARRDLADALALQASYELRGAERALLAETAERFFDVWELQERARHLAQGVSLADTAISAAAARFLAGAAPEVERLRAEGQKAARAAEARRATSQLEAARRLLALQWLSTPAVDSVSLPTPDGWSIPSVDSLLASLASHPQQLAAAAAIAVEEARFREARAARVPDLSVQAGVKRLEETRSLGVVLGLSLALPMWNAGASATIAAEAERDAAQADRDAARTALVAEVERTSARLTGALSFLTTLRLEVAPKARETLALIETGYRAGRFSYLDLAGAQQSLIETELATTDAATEAWRARAELSRLGGGPPLLSGKGGTR